MFMKFKEIQRAVQVLVVVFMYLYRFQMSTEAIRPTSAPADEGHGSASTTSNDPVSLDLSTAIRQPSMASANVGVSSAAEAEHSINTTECVQPADKNNEVVLPEKLNPSMVTKQLVPIHQPAHIIESEATYTDDENDTLPDLPYIETNQTLDRAASADTEPTIFPTMTEISANVVHKSTNKSAGVANKSAKRKSEESDNFISKPKPKKKRKRDPFLVPKRRKSKGGRKALKKKVESNDMFSSFQEQYLQENPVFKICRDGSIEFYYDVYENEDRQIANEEKLALIGPPRTIIMVDEGLSELDLGEMWQEINNDTVDIELLGHREREKSNIICGTDTETVHSETVAVSLPNASICDTPHNMVSSLVDKEIGGDKIYSSDCICHDDYLDHPDIHDAITTTNSNHGPVLDQNQPIRDWNIAVNDHRFQPRVVLTDVRSSAEWDTYVSKDQLFQNEYEVDGPLTLQITSVHSLKDTNDSDIAEGVVSEICKTTNVCSKDDKSCNENISVKNDTVDPIEGVTNTNSGAFTRTRRMRRAKILKSSAYVHDDNGIEEILNVKTDPVGVVTRKHRKAKENQQSSCVEEVEVESMKKRKSRIKSKAIVDYDSSDDEQVDACTAEEPTDTVVNKTSESETSDGQNQKSFDNLLNEKFKLEEQLKHLEQEENKSVVNSPSRYNSPGIDVNSLETMGTQLSLLRDLDNDGNTEKRDMVLQRLSQLRKQLNKRDSTQNEDPSALDLFLSDGELSSGEESIKEKPQTRVEKSCSESNKPDYSDSESENVFRRKRSSPMRDQKYYSSRYRSRHSERRKSSYNDHSKELGRYKESSVRDDKHSRRVRRHRESPDRRRGRDRNRRDSHSKRDSSSPRRRHRSHDWRSMRRHHSSSSRERSPDKKRHGASREKSTDSKHHESRRDKSPDNKRPGHRTERSGDVKVSDQSPEKAKKDGKDLQSVINECTTDNEVKHEDEEKQENETSRDNEEWLKTCDNIFGAKNAKKEEEPALYDAFSKESDSSTCPDPKKWLTTLIRINTKKPTGKEDTIQVNTKKAMSKDDTTSNVVNASATSVSTSPSRGTKSSIATTVNTPKVIASHLPKSTEDKNDNHPSSTSVEKTEDKTPSSLSQQEVIDFVSKVLTIFTPNEAPLSDTNLANQSDLSPAYAGGNVTQLPVHNDDKSENDAELQENRLAIRYPRRKRRSGPVIERQSSSGSSKTPTLWGSQATGMPITSLEEMHQGVTFDEPQISNTSQQSQPTVSIPETTPVPCLPDQPVPSRYGTTIHPVHQTVPANQGSSTHFDSNASWQTLNIMPPPPLPAVVKPCLNVDAIQANAVAVLTLCAVNSAMQNKAPVTCSSNTAGIDVLSHSTRDPRVRRPPISPRLESGSDIEAHIRSPLFSESPTSDYQEGEIMSESRNKINKPWEDRRSTLSAFGNESYAFRDKDRKTVPPNRRVSSTDRREKMLSVDEKFINYTPWEIPIHPMVFRQPFCYESIIRYPDAKDPRMNSKMYRKDPEMHEGRIPTKFCANIPLEVNQIRCDEAVDAYGHSSTTSENCDDHFIKSGPQEKCMESSQLGSIPGLGQDPDMTPDWSALVDPSPGQSKGSRAAAMWSDVLQTPRKKESVYEIDMDVKIGSCNNDSRTAMENVWQLQPLEYQDLNDEMSNLFDMRMQTVEDSLMFSDPTKGLDLHRRLKLISSGNLNDKVVRELQIEEDMRVIKEEVHQKRHELEIGVKTASFSEEIMKELKFEIDVRDIEYEKYNKDLESLKRFYKSSVVEVLPDMFRLIEEKRKFISAEGNMLFVTSALKEEDCKKLYSLREEINEYRRVLENPNGTDEDRQHAMLRLGWLHGERKEALCQLCLNMYRSKDNLMQRFLGKLAWCK